MNFTPSQVKALDYAFEKQGALYAPHVSTGGAFRRCCERLVELHLLNDEPPFPITLKGVRALREIRAARFAKRGCDAHAADLKAVDDALSRLGLA